MKKRGKINVLIEYINIYNYIVNILFTIIYICLIFLGSICSKVYFRAYIWGYKNADEFQSETITNPKACHDSRAAAGYNHFATFDS